MRTRVIEIVCSIPAPHERKRGFGSREVGTSLARQIRAAAAPARNRLRKWRRLQHMKFLGSVILSWGRSFNYARSAEQLGGASRRLPRLFSRWRDEVGCSICGFHVHVGPSRSSPPATALFLRHLLRRDRQRPFDAVLLYLSIVDRGSGRCRARPRSPPARQLPLTAEAAARRCDCFAPCCRGGCRSPPCLLSPADAVAAASCRGCSPPALPRRLQLAAAAASAGCCRCSPPPCPGRYGLPPRLLRPAAAASTARLCGCPPPHRRGGYGSPQRLLPRTTEAAVSRGLAPLFPPSMPQRLRMAAAVAVARHRGTLLPRFHGLFPPFRDGGYTNRNRDGWRPHLRLLAPGAAAVPSLYSSPTRLVLPAAACPTCRATAAVGARRSCWYLLRHGCWTYRSTTRHRYHLCTTSTRRNEICRSPLCPVSLPLPQMQAHAAAVSGARCCSCHCPRRRGFWRPQLPLLSSAPQWLVAAARGRRRAPPCAIAPAIRHPRWD